MTVSKVTASSKLVDTLGMLKAQIADLEGEAKSIQAELLRRHGNEKIIEGVLFQATIVASTITQKYDAKKMVLELGELFMRKFLKVGSRAAYLLVQARKVKKAA